MRNVALDLGKKKTAYCEIADGKVVQRGTVTRVESLSFLLGPEHPPATVAIEACREAWYVHDLLSGWGNRVLLVDTTRNKQLGVGRHGRKTDRIDAEVLARAVERGGIPLAHVLSPHRRELRRVLGIRRALVESRAQLVTTARGVARESGISLPGCTTEHFSTRVRALAKDEPLLCPLEPLLKTIDVVSAELVGVEAELARLCAAEPIITHLCTVPGVGPIVAASFVSVVDDAKRFQRAHHLESYLGLVPNENSSGGKRRLGAITKKGNKYLRTVLVQAAWALLRKASPDDPYDAGLRPSPSVAANASPSSLSLENSPAFCGRSGATPPSTTPPRLRDTRPAACARAHVTSNRRQRLSKPLPPNALSAESPGRPRPLKKREPSRGQRPEARDH